MDPPDTRSKDTGLAPGPAAVLRVVLVDLEPWRLDELRIALEQAGFDIVATVSCEAELYDRVTQLAPDAVIASAESARRDTLDSLMNVSARFPRPTLLLSPQIDDDTLARAMAGGISTYAVEGIGPQVLRSLIKVTVSHFERHSRLQQALRSTQQEMSEREEIAHAKCLLMEHYHMSEENAYRTLRNMAMGKRRRLIAIAREIITDATR